MMEWDDAMLWCLAVMQYVDEAVQDVVLEG